MRVALHPEVPSDISKIMEYYEQVATLELADDFYRELMSSIEEAAEKPGSFGIRAWDIRRVNLHRFPYHFLFQVVDDSVYILVVRTIEDTRRLGAGGGETRAIKGFPLTNGLFR